MAANGTAVFASVLPHHRLTFAKSHTSKTVKYIYQSEFKHETRRLRLKEYCEQANEMIRSDGGPPRWFSPLECGCSSSNKSPLLLYLPDVRAEAAEHEMYLPIVLPKIPGRFYYFFGKPMETEGRKQELRSSREKAKEMYAQTKSEVEKCISFLKEKRERDPYRSVVSRLIFQAKHGFDSQIPTFEL